MQGLPDFETHKDPARNLDFQSSVIAVATALVAAFVFTWIVRAAMRRLRVLDVPRDRKAHSHPVAYEGGIAMYLAFLAGLGTAFWLNPDLLFQNNQLAALILGAGCAVLLGCTDDLLDLPPWLKLLAQVGIGYLMYHCEFRVERVSNLFGEQIIMARFVSIAGTVVWYVLLMNAINIIDGLDGLAAGIAAISGITLFAIAMDLGQGLGALLALLTVAVCVGFLPFNFKPASIFMGDAGSLLLGFLLASVSLLSSTKAPALLALLIPLLALGLPLFDTAFAFLRRILQGKHPFRGDRRHLHHRFLTLGLGERRTVLTFYYITAYFGVTAYVLQRMEARSTLALVMIITVGMLVLVENMRHLERHRNGGDDAGSGQGI